MEHNRGKSGALFKSIMGNFKSIIGSSLVVVLFTMISHINSIVLLQYYVFLHRICTNNDYSTTNQILDYFMTKSFVVYSLQAELRTYNSDLCTPIPLLVTQFKATY